MDTAVSPNVSAALNLTADFFLAFGSDLFVFGTLCVLVLLYAMTYGRDRLVPLAAALYTGLVVMAYFPYESMFGGSAYMEAGAYMGIVCIGTAAYSGLSSWLPSSAGSFVKTALFSGVLALFFVAIAIHLFPHLYSWSPATLALFSEELLFWWLLAPLAGALAFSR